MKTQKHKNTTAKDQSVSGGKTQNNPEKSLVEPIKYRAGRDSRGRIAVRHRGGQQKRKYRKVDFKRDKHGVSGKVVSIEYDPNRSANIALINYVDGEKRYILAPLGLNTGDTVVSGEDAEVKTGNALPLSKIPVGREINSIELKPGDGGKIARSAGNAAIVAGKEDNYVQIKLPSGELRIVHENCYAVIGQVSRPEHKSEIIGKAGRTRKMGFRPTVRGSAMHPGAHPHGGGEGRSPIGMPSPKSPWGKKTLGKKTRKPKKYSNKFIIKDRRSKK